MGSASATAGETKINVTPAAGEAIERLRTAHGDVVFHLPGGCCDARTPVCLPAGDLSIGPRDRLVGAAANAPVYEMGEDANDKSFELDVAEGMPVGFSLSPGDGLCFVLRETGRATRGD